MRNLSKIIAIAAAAFVAVGCTTSFYSSATSSAYDDMYVAHNRTAIAQKQQAEAEARRAEAEARRAEAEALRAQYEAEIARLGGTSTASKQRVDADGLIIVDDDVPTYQSFLADDYESAYARRLLGFKSASYRMPSSYFNLRYGGSYTYVTAYDPAFYNIMVSGDQVWVEPRYITSMFGTWGATNATAMLYSPWYYGWGGWHSYDPWYYSWYGYPRYSWVDWNWNICYGGGWGVNLWWGWGGHYHPWRPYHHHYRPHHPHYPPHHIGGGWWHGNGYGTRHGAPRVVGNTRPAVKPQGQPQGRPQGTPSRTGSVVNRGSTVQTPYRSPITGSTYGQSSRGESNTATQTTTQRTTNTVRRGSATYNGSGAVTTGTTTSSSRSGSVSSRGTTTSSRSGSVRSAGTGSASRSSYNSSASRSTSSYNSSSRSSYSSGSSSRSSYSGGYSGSSSRSGSGSSRGGR